MIHVIPSHLRHHQDFGWLSARWHFSFDTYHDPQNIHWGALRVFNDDVIQPAKGFGFHPHRDMEIITIVLEGELKHRDNLGNEGVVRPGEVQVMSAGTGIVHSEFNNSQTTPLRLLQIWILPERRGLAPRWDQRVFDPRASEGKLLPVVSNGSIDDTLPIHQDAAIYRSVLAAGESVEHETRQDRTPYLFVIRGTVEVNGTVLQAGDQGRMRGESLVRIAAREDAEFLLLDVPASA